MSIIDSLLTNHDSIFKGLEYTLKGHKYWIAYDSSNNIIAYTSGIIEAKQLLLKYLENHDYNTDDVEIKAEYHKENSDFINDNNEFQLCIVNKNLMINKDVMALSKTKSLVPDKRNKRMFGLDSYTEQ